MIHHRFVVPVELAGQRLDRCLAQLSDEWTRSRIRRLVDDGRVTYNGSPAKPATLVTSGDILEVDEPPPQPVEAAAEDIPLAVLYEDAQLIVINKPAGQVVHPAAGNPSGTLVNALLHYCQDLSGIGGAVRPGIVHRLDKDTTGVMVVAKCDAAHLALSRAFSWRKIHKTYLAVCYGEPTQDEWVIDAPIDRHPRHRQQMAVGQHGRTARTRIHVEVRLGGTAMLSCRPITGRTHQIRVHLAHAGHALIGDPLYAGRQWRNLSDPGVAALCHHFPRQALHAWRLEFEHPSTGESVQFEAPVPSDLSDLIDDLRSRGEDHRRVT